jgi:hypothetical protein
LPKCGGFWTEQIVQRMKSFSALPTDRLLTLRNADFYDPQAWHLKRFAAAS